MPQYLACDYLHDLMCQKQANLSRMLIACPPHILKFNTMTANDKFSYRLPWLKGIPVINSKDFLSEMKEELSVLYSKTDCFKSYLQFNGIQYHYTFEKFEEIVPNSDPNSDVEVYDVRTSKATSSQNAASYGYITQTEKDTDEMFSPIPVQDCAHSLTTDNPINLCKDPRCCKLIEPLLTFCTIENGLPDFFVLLSKLNIMTIPDPTGDVNSVVHELFHQDKSLSIRVHTEVASYSGSDTDMEHLSLSPCGSQDYELDLDFIEAIPESKTINNNTHDLKPEAVDSHLPKHLDQDLRYVYELCKKDMHEIQNRKSSGDEAAKINNFPLEKITSNYNLHHSSLGLLLDDAAISFESYEEQNQLELPLAPEATSIVESSSKAALGALKVKTEDLPPVYELNKIISRTTQLKHLRELEKIPSVCGGNSLFQLFISAPAVEQSLVNMEVNEKNYIEEIREACCPQAEPHWDVLDLSLSWDPVAHASDDMALMRHSLHHEAYKLAAFSSSSSLTLENRSEEFITIKLNESFERSITLAMANETKEKVIDSCKVASSITLNENTKNTFSMSDTFSSSGYNECKVNVYTGTKSPGAAVTPMASAFSASSFVKAPCTVTNMQKTVLNRPTEGCDPLADFMLLIGKRQENNLPWAKANDTSSNATVTGKNYQTGGENVSIKRVRSANQSSPARSSSYCEENPSKKPKQSLSNKLGPPGMMTCGEIATQENLSKTIQVYMTGKALDIICMVEREAAPILRELQAKKLLSHNASLINITRETSRFMIKQHQKVVLDKEARGEATDRTDILLLQIFHQIVSTFYLLVHVSFTSGLALLHTSMKHLEQDETINFLPNCHQHVEIFKKLIQNLRFYMCNSVSGVSDQFLLIHPKICELQSFLHKWFSKRRRSNIMENPKAVIICCTYCRYLFSKLCRKMNKPMENGVEIKAVSSADDAKKLTSSDIHRIFERTNVLVIAEQMLFEDFPWESLSLVVDYEHRNDSPWKSLSSNYKIKHVSLQSILPSTSLDLEDDKIFDEAQESSGLRFSEPTQNNLKQPLALIGSTKVTSMGKLLHLLETRHDLLVIERDYSVLGECAGSHPDVIVDENTGIVLKDIENLQVEGEDHVRALLATLLTIRARLSYCLIIVTSQHVGRNLDQGRLFCGAARQNLGRMRASIKQLSNSCNDFEVKMLCCFAIEDLASTIVATIPQGLMSSHHDPNKDTANRSFISSEMSKHERFLLGFPCINSLVAQSLLSTATLEGICRMNVDQILSHSKTLNLPRRIAENIVRCLRKLHEGPEQTDVDTAGDVIDDNSSSYNHKHPRDALSDHRRGRTIVCDNESKHFPMNILPTSTIAESRPVFPRGTEDRWPGHSYINEKPKLHQLVEPPLAPSLGCKETTPSTRLFNQIGPCDVKREQYLPRSDAFHERDWRFPLANDHSTHSHAATKMDHVSSNDPCEDNFQAQDDVHDVMVSARDKLTEFVRNNPGRALESSPREHQVEPSLHFHHSSCADSFYKQGSSNDLSHHRNPNSTAVPWRHDRYEINHNKSNQLFRSTKSPPSFAEDRIGLAEITSQRSFYQNAALPAHHGFSSNFNENSRSHSHHSVRDSGFESFSKQTHRLIEEDATWHPSRVAGRDEGGCSTGASGSVNIGIAQPFSQQPYREYPSNHGCTPQFYGNKSHNFMDEVHKKSFAVVMTPNKRKKMLTYEKVPGRKGGQTRLTFY